MSLEEATEHDAVTEIDGIKFIVDKDLNNRFERVKVDHGTRFFRRGFIISLESDEGGSCN